MLGDTTLVALNNYTDNAFLAEFDQNGTLLWVQPLAGGGDDFLGVATDAKGNVYVGGDYITGCIFGPDTLSSIGEENMFLAKLSHHETPLTSALQVAPRGNSVEVYPNPANNLLTIRYSGDPVSDALATVYDVTGNLVASMQLRKNITNIAVSDLPPGLYICKVCINGTTSAHKVAVVR